MATDSTRDPPLAARGSAEERLTLLLARFISGGYAVYLLLLAPRIREQYPEYASWWPPVALALVFLPAAWMMWASVSADVGRLRGAVIAAAIGYALAIGTWPLAWNGEVFGGDHHPPWLGMIPGLPSMALALVARMPATAAYVMTAVAAAEWAENWRVPGTTLLPQIVWAIGFSLIFATATCMVVRAARLLDRTRRSSRDVAVAASARRAQEAERARFDALTHDWVMSTLLSAARGPSDPAVPRQARDAIERLERLRCGTLADVAFDSESVAAHLRSAVTSIDPARSSAIDVIVERGKDGNYPAAAVRALGAATGEAIRNSWRHAGSNVRRSVDITLMPGSIIVVILDDGIGFDTARVPADRLGISAAIRQQMATVAGGSAEVISAPGRGTRVTLGWAADA